jgi:GNAT superfamily N-acetyltransferase
MRIRRAVRGEGAEMAALWLRSRAASLPHIPPTVHTEEDVHAWFEQVVLPGREVWVADDGNAIVGLLVVHHHWIDQLYVEPSRTNQGIGSKLMAVAKRQRPTALRLWTFEANTGARRFYEHHGFVPTGSTSDNEEGAPAVRYQWPPPNPAATP